MTERNEYARPLGGRRSDRILWPVPIRVTGTDQQGLPFVEETVTVSINVHGACISLTHTLLPGALVLIKNQSNGIEEGFRMVPGGEKVFGERWEWRVEATHPEINIWGIEFNQPAEEVHPKVLIECGTCKNIAYSALTSMEFGLLLSLGMISHHCTRCAQTTRWKPKAPAPAESGASRKANQAPSGAQTRKVRRLELTMRVYVRDSRGVVDAVQTLDVSKGGLAFVSSRDFKIGDSVFIGFPFADSRKPAETKGTILWSAQTPVGRTHGVNYVDAA
ncbi:MAG TPA: PilZ domain-containing protein [Terriglobia bacterium]|nr:PilZ domain-containing protein [Terriglobia bacterium]